MDKVLHALNPRLGEDYVEQYGPLLAIVALFVLAVILAIREPDHELLGLIINCLIGVVGATVGYYVRSMGPDTE